jgi:hypothetical protein
MLTLTKCNKICDKHEFNAVPVALPTIVQNHARKTIGGTVIIDTFV